jgi:catechol 2,3-dioxygenase
LTRIKATRIIRRMEIGARLVRLELSASDPSALARFHAAAFRLDPTADGDGFVCRAPGRELAFFPGEPRQLLRACLRFESAPAWDRYQQTLCERGVETFGHGAGEFSVRDPHGHVISFQGPAAGPTGASGPEARLQHFALRTSRPADLAGFFIDRLGFVVSDRVQDGQGDLSAIFLRTDAEHHTLAIFRAPMARFDHFSCEVPDWMQLRDWADHMANCNIDLAWGVGRHGPGNDTFFMVRDVDGNMGEISAELELCAPDRPAGTWPHRPQTLNRWGVAIMRG